MPGIGQKLVEKVVLLKQLLWLCSVRGKPALFVSLHTRRELQSQFCGSFLDEAQLDLHIISLNVWDLAL